MPATPTTPVPSRITLTASTTLTGIGQTEQIKTSVLDRAGNPISSVTVSWSSSNTAVATVDARGLVTAVGNGTAQITAKAGGASAAITITVMQSPHAITISPSTVALTSIGQTVQLTASVLDRNGRPVTGFLAQWSSSDITVATVHNLTTGQGLVTAVSNGTAQITARAGGASIAVTVTVAQSPDSITISPSMATLIGTGQTAQFTASVLDQNGNSVSGATVSWSSSDTAVAIVSDVGRVTAVGGGTAQITARAGGASASVAVAVVQVNIVITPSSATLTGIGQTAQFTASVLDQSDNPVSGATVSWSSSDTAVAIVSDAGRVTAVGGGTAQITGRVGADSASVTVTVTIPNLDRENLVALYHATDGTNWVNNENWLSDAPLGEWYGVTTDDDGRVTTLRFSEGMIGSIPPEIGGLERLAQLWFGDNPELVGPLPDSFALLRLDELGLGTTQVCLPRTAAFYYWAYDPDRSVGWSGGDRETIFCGELPEREFLITLYNATDGPNWALAENWLSDAPLGEWHGVTAGADQWVTALQLRSNRLSGPIPPEIGRIFALYFLDLASSSGVDPDRNRLSGPIPSEIGQLALLKYLSLHVNALSGPIPPEIGQLTLLESLSLGSNELSGPIPSEIGQLVLLKRLSLGGNELSGPIPSEIGQLALLESLSLGGNELSGSIPPEIGQLGNLDYLNLAPNYLSGPIPPEIGQLGNLDYLGLDANKLSGPIPSEIGQLTLLRSLTLGGNELSGPIPPEIGQLGNLDYLGLGANKLSGPIPPEIGQLTRLTNLNLSDNPDLSGRLPESFTGLELSILDLSNTSVCVPSTAPFQNWIGLIEQKKGITYCSESE